MFGIKMKSQPLPPVSTEPIPGTSAGSSAVKIPEPEPETLELSGAAAPQQTLSGTEEKGMYESDLTASVSRNTVFTGNIVSHDNVEIFGEVEGSVTSAAVVKIHGKVHGDVTCGVLVASNATIIGNIDCEKSAVFGNDTNVNGNVTATVMTVSGQINGNLTASESVSVCSTGTIYGDISTPEIEVSKGAIVFGSVVMEQAPEEPPVPEEPPAPKAPEPAQPAAEAKNTSGDKGAPKDGKAEELRDEKKNGTQDESDGLGPWTADKKTDSKNGHNPFSIEEHA